MSILMDEILKDPEATYQIEFDLASGNTCGGTIGPVVGNRLSCSVWFLRDPTEEDIASAHKLLSQMLGETPSLALTGRTPEERKANLKHAEKFMREVTQ